MKYKGSMIMIMLAIFLFAVAAVGASDANDTAIASTDETPLELSENDETLLTEEIQTEGNEIIGETDNGTFAALNNKISTGTDPIIKLENNYTYEGTGYGNGITISRSDITIDGQGHTIDAKGQTRIFDIRAGNVVLKNIIFKNGKTEQYSHGGAISFSSNGEVTNCTFTNNTATQGRGGAISFYSNGEVTNCTFTNNQASYSGAIYTRYGTVTNCTFTNNTATQSDGGAISFYSNGEVTNCTFTNNTAKTSGGAIFIKYGTVTNCTFTNNQATSGGGAISFSDRGTVTNCTFTNNQATSGGGAIYTHYGTVINCTFTNSTAQHGGAIYFEMDSNVGITNCTFTNSTAQFGGGAIYLSMRSNGYITNCNFANTATQNGGVIYLGTYAHTTLDTCIFKTPSDTPNAGTILPPTLNVDNFTTLYNSGEKITFDLKTNSSMPVYNGNISISVYKKNGDWVGNYSCMSGDGWTVNLPIGEYYAIYNTEYAAFTPINRTITVTAPEHTFTALNYIINGNGNRVINLTNDFYFDPAYDADFVGGIPISRSVTIKGNGKTIDAKGKARIFEINRYNVVLENITFINGKTTGFAGAVYFKYGSEAIVTNCIFMNNQAAYGGAIESASYKPITVTNCIFMNNQAAYGGAIMGMFSVKNCNFMENTATNMGGALYFSDTNYIGIVTNCNFTNNRAIQNGGAISMISGSLKNCNFTNNQAQTAGAIKVGGDATVENCNFIGNNASRGSAIHFIKDSTAKTISNSTFLNNRADLNSLQATINESNVEILFIGKNNIINAIYSESDVNSTNVIYWGAEGIATVSGTISRSDREAGQNITVTGVVNGNIINATYITDDEGKVVLTDVADYWITVRHNGDTYYTEYETVLKNMTFCVNVTEIETNNRTVNLTAASNIYKEVLPGQLMFILPNGDNITANYGANGTWWAVHIFDDYGVYNINGSYEGLDNVKISNAIINVSKADSTLTVNDIMFDYKATGSSDISFTYASGVTAKVIDHPETAVNVKDNKITVSGLDAGTYTLSVTTLPDADHNAVTKTVKVTVRKLKTELTAKAVTATYKVNKNLVITLKDAKGNPIKGVKVTVKIKSSKTLKTDSKGQIKVSTKGLAPKKYTAKITFSGNKNYLKSTKSVKVTVKKAKPKITAKKKTYKTTTKTKKYTVTLKDNKGKAIKKAKLTLKVKGKTYKAKTNKKGKATFKVTKLNKKGTYKATVTYKGNKYYKKVSKKAKIKVIVTFKTVSKGSKDKNTVKEIQQALKDQGYYTTYKGHYLKVDGKYGKYTVKSIKQFQSDKKLKVTGKVDEKTAKKLKILQ